MLILLLDKLVRILKVELDIKEVLLDIKDSKKSKRLYSLKEIMEVLKRINQDMARIRIEGIHREQIMIGILAKVNTKSSQKISTDTLQLEVD